jgi:hypothetical protein
MKLYDLFRIEIFLYSLFKYIIQDYYAAWNLLMQLL